MLYGMTRVVMASTLSALLCVSLVSGPASASAAAAAPLAVSLAVAAPVAVSLAAADDFTCAIIDGGSVECWGDNLDGGLGSGVATGTSDAVRVAGITTAVRVAAGDGHACAVLTNGTVRCWGTNSNGELGDGTRTLRRTPVGVVDISTAIAVSAGIDQSCAVLADHSVWCWGANDNGQLGIGTTVAHTTPVRVSGISDALAISGEFGHTCVLLTGGSVKCWGFDESGELGGRPNHGLFGSLPVVVPGISGATAITTGGWHTCVLMADGTIQCWGQGGDGQVGNGVDVASIDDLDGRAYWPPVSVLGISTATSISAGSRHTCAVLADGTVRCWGRATEGQLGDGSLTTTSTPVMVGGISNAVAISAGTVHTCALVTGGQPQCWGSDLQGQLGDGQTLAALTPRLIAGLTSVSIDAGGLSTCVIAADRTVWCWRGGAPAQVPGLASAVALSVGTAHACAVLADRTIWCWGSNRSGQLGDGTSNSRDNPPVRVVGITTAQAVSAGYDHTCAVLVGHSVWCWGANTYGQLGNGARVRASAPVRVKGISTAAAVSAGDRYACALLASGSLRCWGRDADGQLGDGRRVSRTTAVAVRGITNATSVSASEFLILEGSPFASSPSGSSRGHACASLRDGTIRCWGANNTGQLGNGRTTDSLAPVRVTGVSTATGVVIGSDQACATLIDGTVRCWGRNTRGEIGDGTVTTRRVPVIVPGIGAALAVSPGTAHTCAILDDRSVACWGSNLDGQLGDDRHMRSSTPVDVVGLAGASDTVAPVVSRPVVAAATGASQAGIVLPVMVSWSAADERTSVATYELEWSNDGGTLWNQVALSSPTATTAEGRIELGSAGTSFRVRARDSAGNWSAWRVSPRVRDGVVDETSSRISYAGSWANVIPPGPFAMSWQTTRTAGASATFSFTGRSIAWIGVRTPASGNALVYVDGNLAAIVSLHSAASQPHRVAFARSWAVTGRHRIRVVCAGTSGHSRVSVDAFIVLADPGA